MTFFNNDYLFHKTVGDSTVCINLLNEVIFLLSKEKYELFSSFKDDLSSLQTKHPVFFSTMLKLGAIEEKEKTTYEKYVIRNREIVYNKNEYRLTINPTLNCNCNCWYCYETHNKKIINNNTVENIYKFVNKHIEENGTRRFMLDWFGGEPLLCYETRLIPITYKIKEICNNNRTQFESGITTNGYLIKKEMIDFFKNAEMNNFQITLDGYKNDHNKTRIHNKKDPTFDKIVENICMISEYLSPRNLVLRINYTKSNIDNIHKISDCFSDSSKKNITVMLQQVWQDKESEKIPISEIEKIKMHFRVNGFKIHDELFNYKCYTCYADLFNQSVINYDGRVFKCTARNFINEEHDGILNSNGYINWNNQKIFNYISTPTFENEKCKKCIFLPICFGPCGKKIALIKNRNYEFDKFCFENGIKDSLDYIVEKFINSKLAFSFIHNIIAKID